MFSLQALCIDLIAQKFELFYFTSTVLKDKSTHRNFEFLQRRFSVQLADALHKKKNLKKKYLEILLNEHLTFLDGQWFKNISYMNCMEDFLSCLPNLRKICFGSFGDEILEYLAIFCPKIFEIDMRNSNVTDQGIEYLCKKQNRMVLFPELKMIFLDPSRITDRGVKILIQNFPLIERIDYPNVPLLLHSSHASKLLGIKEVDCYNLVELKVPREFRNLHYYTDVLKACLTVCPKLESMECCITEQEQLTFFSNCNLKKCIIHIYIFDQKINMDNFLKENGRSFTFLELYNCTISVSSLPIYCPVLKKFSAHDMNFTHDDGIKPQFPSLAECHFSEIDILSHESACLLFSFSPNLKSIHLCQSIISVQMKTQILKWCKSSSAESVAFVVVYLKMKFLREILLSCPTLKMMCLFHCTFDVQGTKEVLYNFAKCLQNKPKIL